MADDDLSPLAPPATAADEASPGAAPAANPVEQLGSVIANAIKPDREATDRRFEAMERNFQGLAQVIAQQQGAQQAQQYQQRQAEAPRVAPLDEFVSDIPAWRQRIVDEARQQAAQQIAPYLIGVNADAQERTIEAEATRIDRVYGDGAFDAVVRPHLEGALANMAEPLRFNPKAIKTATAALVGSAELSPELEKRRTETSTKKAAVEKAERQKPPSFLGVPRGTTRTQDDDIDDDDRAVLAAIQKSGFEIDEQEWKQTRALPRGASFEDQIAALDRGKRKAS